MRSEGRREGMKKKEEEKGVEGRVVVVWGRIVYRMENSVKMEEG